MAAACRGSPPRCKRYSGILKVKLVSSDVLRGGSHIALPGAPQSLFCHLGDCGFELSPPAPFPAFRSNLNTDACRENHDRGRRAPGALVAAPEVRGVGLPRDRGRFRPCAKPTATKPTPP